MIKISLYLLMQDTSESLVSVVVKHFVELYTYSVDITQQEEQFPQF